MLDLSTSENRGRLSGQYQMWFFLGTGGAALAGGVLTDLIGFRPALAVGAALTALAGVLWLVFLPRVERQVRVQPGTPETKPPPRSLGPPP